MNNLPICTDSNLIEHKFRESRKITLPSFEDKRTKRGNIPLMRMILKKWYSTTSEVVKQTGAKHGVVYNMRYKVANYIYSGGKTDIPHCFKALVEEYRDYILQLSKDEYDDYQKLIRMKNITKAQRDTLQELNDKINMFSNNNLEYETPNRHVFTKITTKVTPKIKNTKKKAKVEDTSTVVTTQSIDSNTDFVSLLAKLKETGLAEITIKFKV